jgi:hypothetical protein
MPRKTKAQREAELQESKLQLAELQRKEYFPMLMKTLEDSTSADFILEVIDGNFIVRTDNWVSVQDAYRISPVYNEESWNTLLDLHFSASSRIFEIKEAQRKEELRRAAYEKLSEEEREVWNMKLY